MQHDSPEFHDAALKAALKRALAGEVAPAGLRRRILATAGEEPETIVIPLWRHPAFRLAAAFLLVLIGVYGVLQMRSPKSSVPQGVLAGMVGRHDRCVAGEHDHHQRGVPQDDFHLMGQSLAGKLHISVLAADLRKDGWAFGGAATCPVNGTPTAHLLFASSRGSLSLFSIPPVAAPGAADGGIVSQSVSEHEVSLFVHGGVVYAAVGHGSITPDEVRQLLVNHRDDIVAAAVAMGIAPAEPEGRLW